MSRSGDRRDLQLDVMTKSLERQQGEALGKLLQPTALAASSPPSRAGVKPGTDAPPA